ncbi:hypothetical protein D9758_002817 [Tetrapyrgos nigripes]|uniref:F-box domain-containing protein n=1 Tax=Tetrapyrgos nigripes TaxID=182062 RepID=A0A8H5LTT9_9AGAR|nr:hypothetical protein D9758_002817 [Tetrapyrgos nigripes]
MTSVQQSSWPAPPQSYRNAVAACCMCRTPSLTSKDFIFPLAEMPTEIALNILVEASIQSQSTYLALLLTSHAIHRIIRLEVIPNLPITLTSKEQVYSFAELVAKDSAVANRPGTHMFLGHAVWDRHETA